jgi:class 3 adenylate cyclase/putative methionine-R-sulfoxide reductase with GAF domain
VVDLRVELETARQQAREAINQQSALIDILRVMSGSASAVGPVLDAIVQHAVRLSDADSGSVMLFEKGIVTIAGQFGMPPEDLARNNEFYRTRPFMPGRKSLTGRVLMERQTVLIPDLDADPDYERIPGADHRASMLGVPLLRADGIAGVILVRKPTPGGFSPEQVKVVEAFATQAVIAIENVRLFNETKEALERQTATGEVLAAIGRAGFDARPVFDLALAHAGRLCGATIGGLWLREGDLSRWQTGWFADGVVFEDARDYYQRHPGNVHNPGVTGRVYRAGAAVQIPDVTVDPDYPKEQLQYLRGEIRTNLGVPLLKDGTVIGVLSLGRREVRPFDDHDIALVRTFADQVVLAIENARLLQAVERQRQELTRFVSPQVASLLTSDEGHRLLEGHRRAITVLFCDLRGFSAFSETAEPEEVLGLLREYHAAMGELIIAHGGTLEHFAGDGMMVFFNDPVPVTDHELQAVRLAVAMRSRFEAMAQAWRRKGYELGFGIGAAVGHATLGRIGFEGRYDYGAIGNAVIVASRLSGEAKAGQILLTQRLHAAVEQQVDADAIGELSLKGQTRPVAAFNVTGLRAAR